MKVDDLYIILREINQIYVLQANLLAGLKRFSINTEAYRTQLIAYQELNEILNNYAKFNI